MASGVINGGNGVAAKISKRNLNNEMKLKYQ
jgi:hypothetical protein